MYLVSWYNKNELGGKFDSETASDWIGTFKGPNVCTQRFSRVWLQLFASHSFVREKISGFQGT